MEGKRAILKIRGDVCSPMSRLVNLFKTLETDNNKAGDKEVLHPSSERFRMKLIRDFRLLENLTEMEAGLEAPKYHASDITEKPKREKLLSDNPNALVKFNTVSRRIENPKYEKLNEVQSQRLHRIKYRLATIPPLKYLANNVVESKKFKRIIKFIGKRNFNFS